jgi:hypothetical protein
MDSRGFDLRVAAESRETFGVRRIPALSIRNFSALGHSKRKALENSALQTLRETLCGYLRHSAFVIPYPCYAH